MIFSPELADMVMAGTKTVTRRRLYGDASFGWGGPTRYKVGRTYAVQPGRGKRAIGRILVTSVRTERLGDITQLEAGREGFPTPGQIWGIGRFLDYWVSLYGAWNPEEEVAVIDFEVVKEEPQDATN